MALKSLADDYGVHSAYFGGQFYVVWRECEGTNIQAGLVLTEGSAREELQLCGTAHPFSVAGVMPNVDVDTTNTAAGDQWRSYLLGMGTIMWCALSDTADDDPYAGHPFVVDGGNHAGMLTSYSYSDGATELSYLVGRSFYDDTLGKSTGTNHHLWNRIICSI